MPKKVLVTGGTSGLGLYVTHQLVKRGYKVTVTGRNAEALADLQTVGVRAVAWNMTLQHEQTDWPLELLETDYDVVVINAGVGFFKTHDTLTPDEIREMLVINVELPMLLARYHSPFMQQKNKGLLLFIGSLAGRMASPKASVYAASKHALTGYVQGLRMELMDSGVDVSIVQPGPIDTPFIDKADQSGGYKKALGKHILSIEQVGDIVMQQLDSPKGEVLVPGHLGAGAKLAQLAPLLFERYGKRIYAKK